MQPRTKRQKEVLDYITRFVDRNGYEPSYQQIARQLGVASKGGILRHIVALENLGLITRKRENGNFAIEIRSKQIDTGVFCTVELVEIIDEGGCYKESSRSMLPLPKAMIGPLHTDEVFAFIAPDDRISERHICEGDIVLAERRNYASRGDTVFARTGGGRIALGRYFQQGLETEIRPANDHFETQSFPADEVVIEGVVRGLLRPIPDLSN